MGGGILTQGLASSSSPESESPLSSVVFLPKGLAFHFLLLECQGLPSIKASHRAATNWSILEAYPCESRSIIPCHRTHACCHWHLLFLVFLWEFLLFLPSHHLSQVHHWWVRRRARLAYLAAKVNVYVLCAWGVRDLINVNKLLPSNLLRLAGGHQAILLEVPWIWKEEFWLRV